MRFLATKFFLLTLLVNVHAQDDGVVVDKIIAKVDNYIVLKSDLERAYLDYLSRGELNRGNAKCEILESLVVNKMLVAKAEIDSVEVADEEVAIDLDRRIDYMVAQIGSEQEIEKFYGKSLDQIKEELFEDIKEQKVIQRMQQEISTDLKVTPSEVKKFFATIPRDSLPYFSTEVTVSQIVKKPTPGKKQEENVRKKLLEI
ncbi:MAG: peptidylprolyl isomerase, partial [Cyclobacteriaceae bacterium]|nr:peptidylprolyl isomerase [Cyclobacteriaceae bacterium HetDA_MAG_MS6]